MGRPEIIHTGRITVQDRRACWIFQIKPSRMEKLPEHLSSISRDQGLVDFLADSDKGQESIASPRASQRFAEIKPTEYGCECPGRGSGCTFPASEKGRPDIIMTCRIACSLLANWGGVVRKIKLTLFGSLKRDYLSGRIVSTESTLWHLSAESPLSDEIEGFIILVNKRSTIPRKHPNVLNVLPVFTRH